MPDAEMAVEPSEGGFVEDLGHQTQVLEHGDRLPVRRGDAGRLLAPVLEPIETEVDEAGDTLPGRIGGEDPARLAGAFGEQDGNLGHGPIVGRGRRSTYSVDYPPPKRLRYLSMSS